MSSKNIEQVDSSIGGGTGVIHCSYPPLAGAMGWLLICFAARSGIAPYSLIALTSLFTHHSLLVARRYSPLFTHCSSLVARRLFFFFSLKS
jgi:hypothetical protein